MTGISPDVTHEGPALEELEGMPTSDLENMRELCKHDNFFLGKFILGYDELDEAAHGPLCNFMATCDDQYRMVLVFRGFFKSTINNTDAIREGIADPDHSRQLIINEIEDNAIDFLTEIKNHWESNVLLRFLFRDLIPDKFVGPGAWWSVNEACLKRAPGVPWKEPTWTAMGLMGAAQSHHYTHIRPDDIIGEKHKESLAEMKRAVRWNSGIRGLMVSLRKSRVTWLGTRKTMDDVYADIQKKYKSRLTIFTREPLEDGKSIFPERFPTEELLRIMDEEPEVWAHDYMNNPVGAGGVDWSTGNINYFTFTRDMQVCFTDPLTRVLRYWRLQDLDLVMTVDPNSGKQLAPDKAIVMVHGTSPEEQIFLLRMRSGRPSPDGLIDWVMEEACAWGPRVIGVEDAGQQSTIFYLNKRMEDTRRWFAVEPLKHVRLDKEKRIRTALDTPLKARRFYMLAGAEQAELRMQLLFFPQLAQHNWDAIDCLSFGPELYQKGMRVEDLQRARNARIRLIRSRGITGYGRSVH